MAFQDFGMLAIIDDDNRKLTSSIPLRCNDCRLCSTNLCVLTCAVAPPSNQSPVVILLYLLSPRPFWDQNFSDVKHSLQFQRLSLAINISNSSVDLGPISVEDVCVVFGDACPKHTCLICGAFLGHLSPFVQVLCSFILFICFCVVCYLEKVAKVSLMPLFYQHSFTPVRGCDGCIMRFYLGSKSSLSVLLEEVAD